ncbi:MAG: ABC transporter permease subunit [Chloroflexota bacterium]|nr:ABC transporter permease subunit [Chloroflexota bacterium]
MCIPGAGVVNLVLVLSIGQWVTYARIVRGSTIAQREKEYVEAARSIGASSPCKFCPMSSRR